MKKNESSRAFGQPGKDRGIVLLHSRTDHSSSHIWYHGINKGLEAFIWTNTTMVELNSVPFMWNSWSGIFPVGLGGKLRSKRNYVHEINILNLLYSKIKKHF